jgi:hypothetical protein
MPLPLSDGNLADSRNVLQIAIDLQISGVVIFLVHMIYSSSPNFVTRNSFDSDSFNVASCDRVSNISKRFCWPFQC